MKYLPLLALFTASISAAATPEEAGCEILEGSLRETCDAYKDLFTPFFKKYEECKTKCKKSDDKCEKKCEKAALKVVINEKDVKTLEKCKKEKDAEKFAKCSGIDANKAKEYFSCNDKCDENEECATNCEIKLFAAKMDNKANSSSSLINPSLAFVAAISLAALSQ